MIIERRKDYEGYEFPRHQRPWRRMYQVGKSIYKVNLISQRAFWDEWMWFAGHRSLWDKIRCVYLTLRYDLVMYYGEARTTEELNAEADDFNKRWKAMVDSGAIERCFRDDIKALELDLS